MGDLLANIRMCLVCGRVLLDGKRFCSPPWRMVMGELNRIWKLNIDRLKLEFDVEKNGSI